MWVPHDHAFMVGQVLGTRAGAASEEAADRLTALLVFGSALGNLVAVALRHSRYVALRATTAAECRRAIAETPPDLVFIDIDQHADLIDEVVADPDHAPVLAFTRRRTTRIKIEAIERGVDEIIEVPFTLDEIVSRPYALLRRARGIKSQIVPRITIGGGLEVDLLEQTVRINGGPRLELTPIQQSLLYVLAANAGDVLTREDLLTSIWGADFQIESNVVDRHIRELRVKLGDDWRSPRFIETVPGRGYRFRPASE